METPKVDDRPEAWWTAWEDATEATEAYEATGRDEYRQTALVALRRGAFPNSRKLRARLQSAGRHYATT